MHIYDVNTRTAYSVLATKAASGQPCSFTYAPGTAYLKPLGGSEEPTLAVPISALHEALRLNMVLIISSEARSQPDEPQKTKQGKVKVEALFRQLRRPHEPSTFHLRDIGRETRDPLAPALSIDAHIEAIAALELHARRNLYTPESKPTEASSD